MGSGVQISKANVKNYQGDTSPQKPFGVSCEIAVALRKGEWK